MADESITGERKHFLVSYADLDRKWAEWIGNQLEKAGYKTILRDWDFRPGSNVILEMNDAIISSERTLLVITLAYLNSPAFVEWNATFRNDPRGKLGRVLPVRVELCNLQGLLETLRPIDLVGLPEEQATQRLLDGVLQTRARNDNAPFPGPTASQDQFSPIPNEQFQFQVQQIEGLLRTGDYNTAHMTIDGLLRSFSHDYTSQQRARLLYLQGLVYLKGHRPYHLTHPVIKSAGTLLSQATREHPLRVYAATLAAVECDFARGGLQRVGVNPIALLEQASRLRISDEDAAAIAIFKTIQPELYQDYRRLFSN
jgi:hypothetical protein